MCIKWYINWKIYEANKDKYKDPDNVKNTCAYFVAKQIGLCYFANTSLMFQGQFNLKRKEILEMKTVKHILKVYEVWLEKQRIATTEAFF